MPTPATLRSATPRWLKLLLITFAAAAAILWLLGFLAPHSVLFPSGPAFEDVLVYQGRFTVYHTAKFFTARTFSAFAYPAGAAPIYAALYATTDAVQTYLILAAITTAAAFAAAFFFLRRHATASLFPWLLVFTFPLIFLIQRANIELFLWIIVACGILAFRRGWAIAAAVLFGLAAAVKLYPIFLLGLFLKRKRDLSAFVTGLFTALLSMAAAIAYAGPTFSIAAKGFTTGLDRFQNHYVDTVSKVEVAFDHSLFSPFKYNAFLNHPSPAPWRHTYYLVAASIAVLLFLRIRTLPFLNRVVFLVAAMVCLPPVSFNYTLVHLYLPTLLLLIALATLRTAPPITAAVALAILLFLTLPLSALTIFGPLPTGPMQSFALATLMILSALTPWPQPPATAAA
jgi:hypothetical protein